MEIDFIMNHRDKGIIKEQLKGWSKAILSGELPHAMQAMIHLTAALLAAWSCIREWESS